MERSEIAVTEIDNPKYLNVILNILLIHKKHCESVKIKTSSQMNIIRGISEQ